MHCLICSESSYEAVDLSSLACKMEIKAANSSVTTTNIHEKATISVLLLSTTGMHHLRVQKFFTDAFCNYRHVFLTGGSVTSEPAK